MEEDTAIGIFFAASMALGLVFLHLSRAYNVDVFGFLFGNILAIGTRQLWQILVVTVGVLAVILAFFKELVFLSFDEEMAWVSGVPVKALRYLFLVIMALVVIVTIYLVGIILVSALLVIPGAIAQNLARQLKTMVWVSTGGGGGRRGGRPDPVLRHRLSFRGHHRPGPDPSLPPHQRAAPLAAIQIIAQTN